LGEAEMTGKSRTTALWAGWALLAGWTVAATFTPGTMMEESLTPIPMLYIALAILHAWIGFGWRGALALIAAGYVLGFSAECTSIHTGFPFGWYDHTDVLGTKLFRVPLFIPIGFFAIGYLGWSIARLIVEQGRGRSLLWTPIVTGLVASQLRSRHRRDRRDRVRPLALPHSDWHLRRAADQLSRLDIDDLGDRPRLQPDRAALRADPADDRPALLGQPPLFWAIAALQFPISYYVFGFGAGSTEVVVRGARSWMVADIYEGAVIVALLTMLPPPLMALARLWPAQK